MLESGATAPKHLLMKHSDTLRIRLGHAPPAKVEHTKVELQVGSKPIACPLRRYPPAAPQFMKRYANRLLQFGFVVLRKTMDCRSNNIEDATPGNVSTHNVSQKAQLCHHFNAIVYGTHRLRTVRRLRLQMSCFNRIRRHFLQTTIRGSPKYYSHFKQMDRVIKHTQISPGTKNAASSFQSKIERLSNI